MMSQNEVIEVLIQRPLESTQPVTRKLRIMQCLSRVEEGEDPDCTFDKDGTETPLESALAILDVIQDEFQFDLELLRKNKQMLKEAAVVVCIKKEQYDKASSILRKYISNHSGTKKLRAELQEIIQEKNLRHPTVQNFSFFTIKQKIYQLFENYIDDITPFLLTAARKAHQMENATKEPTIIEQKSKQPSQSSPTDPPQPVRSEAVLDSTYSLSVIKSKFKVLCQDPDPNSTFTELCETDYYRKLTPVASPTKKRPREGSSPRERSSASKSLCGRTVSVTLNRLVMEQDSQCEEWSENADTSQGKKQKTDSPPQKVLLAQSQNVTPKRKKNSMLNTSDVPGEQDSWSEEDDLFKTKRSTDSSNSTSSNSGKRQKWTAEETEWIRHGVKKYGEGNWSKICKRFPFQNRTSVMIKDRWRTMKKLGLV
ncbi:telomeric repeat-binding factor 2 isoform 2-T2 [Discoglossus pictus]